MLAGSGLLALLTIVFSLPALGNGSSPSAECASTDPAWNGDFWKAEKDDGVLGEIETTVAGAISLASDGSWTNNHEDPMFRVVFKFDDDDDDDDDEVQVLSGMWKTGEGGTLGVAVDELDHVTFCSTSEVVEEPEPTTTTLSSPTTAAPATTTTAPGPTTTTSPGPTTTDQGASPAVVPEEPTTTSPSDDPTTPSAEAGASGLASDGSQAVEAVDQADGTDPDDIDSPPGTDRDTTAAGPAGGGPEDPPALGQEAPDAGPDWLRGPDQWTLADLAILGGLIAAIAALVARKRLRRLVSDVGERWR